MVSNAFDQQRNASTAIYFLLTESNFSAFHRIKSDEMWHHYEGDPLTIHTISPKGVYEILYLGHDRERSHRFQAMVKAGYWFASEVSPGGTYTFAGCTVSPGFDFQDFEMAEKSNLAELFPQHEAIISRLSR